MYHLSIRSISLLSFFLFLFVLPPAGDLQAQPSMAVSLIPVLPNDIEEIRKLGVSYSKSGDYENAAAQFALAYDRLLERTPGGENCRITLNLGMTYIDLDDKAMAYLFLQKTLDLYNTRNEEGCGTQLQDKQLNWVRMQLKTIETYMELNQMAPIILSKSELQDFESNGAPHLDSCRIEASSLENYRTQHAPDNIAFDARWWSKSGKFTLVLGCRGGAQRKIYVGTFKTGTTYAGSGGTNSGRTGTSVVTKQRPEPFKLAEHPGLWVAVSGGVLATAGGVAMIFGATKANAANDTYNQSNRAPIDAQKLHGTYIHQVLPMRTGGGVALGIGTGALIGGVTWALLDARKAKGSRHSMQGEDSDTMHVRGISVAPAMDGMGMAIDLSF